MEAYEELEVKFGKTMSMPNMVSCSSGTAALHLALESLCLPKGGKIIIPDFTMIACARAVTLSGLIPVTVDCNEDLLIDIKSIEKMVLIHKDIVGIMPVHIYGRKCNMSSIIKVATSCDLVVVEDLAEAHGIMPHPSSDAACWSFYKNKIVCGEEGGAVGFRLPDAASRAKSLRSLGFTKEHNFTHTPRGHNYRLANLLATPIIESLKWLPHNLNLRREIEHWYNDELQTTTASCGLHPSTWSMPPRDVVWVYDIRIPGLSGDKQTTLVTHLNERGVAARHAFKPVSKQEEYKDCINYDKGMASLLSREVIYLPTVPGVTTKKDVHKTIDIIKTMIPPE